jgi:hypothetical protein
VVMVDGAPRMGVQLAPSHIPPQWPNGRAPGAATRGLMAEPRSEFLLLEAIRAAVLRGDRTEVIRLADRLDAQIERIDPDGGPEHETIELLRVVGYRQVS